jgi:acetyl esterase/lipase
MTSRHLVDPEILPLLGQAMAFSSATLPLIRNGLRAQSAANPPLPDMPVTMETILVPGPATAPPVRVLLYRPVNASSPLPTILHIHGGGYVLGTAAMMDLANRILAMDLGCIIASVDYRLAPEAPFPGPVEDCYAALKFLAGNAAQLGVDPTCIGVKGESAGGGLAAALALLARDRGEISLAFQHLIYPMLDDRTCTTTNPHPFTGEFIWTASDNRFGWSSLLGTSPGGHGISPYAAAARAENLSGLPPAFISVGALDLFLDEDLDYATRLMRAGVPVELHVYPGAFHGFQLAPKARVTIAAERDSLESLRRALHG